MQKLRSMVFPRLCAPLLSSSFFLFGARATGKSTFLRSCLEQARVLWIDLLDPELEERFLQHPRLFYDHVKQHPDVEWVVLDEVQKCPLLLNYVHKLIEEGGPKFSLTGSSARKLRRGAANLLAGRALLNEMYPLTAAEQGERFHLMEVLHWGSLPGLFAFGSDEERKAYLSAYAHTYLREEILAEQLVRRMLPFRRFLEVSAQCHATQLSFRKLGRELQLDGKTVQSYFEVLEDTLVGFLLYPHHTSLRKSLTRPPKFYFFDLGVQRALAKTLDSRFARRTSAFGDAFESFVILEIKRHNSYSKKDYTLEYFSDGRNEIDLILSSGRERIAIEIKSSDQVRDSEIEKFSKLADSIEASRKVLMSLDQLQRNHHGVECLQWQSAIVELFA
ncbi:ATP-binding protein [bacterium CPR1]|nr:ATP-binding protein [bacterium CPR1]